MTITPNLPLPFLPPTTVCPNPVNDTRSFVQFINRMYEDIAFAMNSKNFASYEIGIGTDPLDIPNLDRFGSWIVAVSGLDSGMPMAVWALCKADSGISGATGITLLSFQSGTVAPWGAVDLIVTSTATNFQIATNAAAGTFGNFQIDIMGSL